MIDLSKKVFIVAGAGGRLGGETVSSILEHGGKVLATDSSDKALERLNDQYDKYPNFTSLAGDICDSTSVRECLEKTKLHFGELHGAVNAAYPRNANYGKPYFDVSYRDFCENLSLHLGGYFLFTQQCALFAKTNSIPFSLVNISSIYGSLTPRFEIYEGTNMTMPVEYASIKAGIEHGTRYACAVTKGSRFRANCVSPGGIEAGQPDAFVQKYNRFASTKGMLDPGDVVGTILFLLSDASAFVVGQNIIVDDGFSN